MTIEVSDKQLAALMRGDRIAVGPSKRVITLDDGPFVVNRSYPAPHCGRQGDVGGSAPRSECAGGETGDEDYEWKPTEGEYAIWSDNDQLVKIIKDVDDEQVDIQIVSGPDRGGFFDGAFIDDLEEPDYDLLELWTADDIDSTIARSKEIFGLTDDWSEAGYILDDGDMLDFSGKNQGGSAGTRAIDHRQIGQAFEGDAPSYTEGMVWFMDKANAIRMSRQSGDLMVDFAGPPTRAQRNLIESIGTQSNAVYWDVSRWYDADTEAGTEGHFITIESGETSNELEEIEDMLENIRTIYYRPDYEERSWIARIFNQIVNRGGPGSGFYGHVGRPKEIGGSAPAGSLSPSIGRAPLPAGGRDAPESQPRNIMKPPEMLADVEYEDVSYHASQLIDLAERITWASEEAKREFLGNARVIAGQTPESGYMKSLKEEYVEEATQKLVKELYWLYQELKYETDVEGALEGFSSDQLDGLEDVEEFLDDYVSGKFVTEPVDGDQWEEDYYIPGFDEPDDESGFVFEKYQGMIPDRIRNNPYMFKQYQLGLLDLLNQTRAEDELYPFHSAPEDGEGGTTFEPFIDVSKGDFRLAHRHPDVQQAIGEAWRKRAMTEGTPENSQAIKYGGADPRFWIEAQAAFLTEDIWTPAVYLNTELYETADAINAGWQQSTATPGGQLAMESAERLFGPMTGAEAPNRNRNEIIKTTEELEEVGYDDPEAPYKQFKVGFQNYQKMTAADIHAFLDDPKRQAEADEVIDITYEQTQKWFRRMGYGPDDLIPLYRGMGNLEGDWNLEREASDESMDSKIGMYSLSSWTAHMPETKGFTGRSVGAVIKAMVPVNRILATPQTGFPCASEFEYVVLGGPDLRGTIHDSSAKESAIIHDMVGDYGPDWVWALKDQLEGGWYKTPDYQPLPGGVVKAVDMGGGFSIPEGSGIDVRGGGQKFTIPADATAEDWIAENLAAFDLTRGLLDGTETTDAEGNELEQKEIDLLLDRYYIAKRKAAIQANKSAQEHNKTKGAIIQRGGPGSGYHGHAGRPGEVGGSQETHEAVADVPYQREREGFSHPLPNEADVRAWFETHHMPIDLVDVYANKGVSQHRHAFDDEQLRRWNEERAKDTERVIEELNSMDLKTLDKEKYLRTERRQGLMEVIKEAEEKAAEAGDEEAQKYYSEIWSQLLFSTRQASQAVDFVVRRAISNGELTPEEGAEIDKYDYGKFEGSRPWKPLPETLYHTTVAGSAIRETGLKSRFELGGDAQGLGGGNDQTVSYTDSREWAEAIERTIQEVQQVSAGEVTASDLLQNAAQGIGNNGKPWLINLMGFSGIDVAAWGDESEASPELKEYLSGPKFDPNVPIPDGLASEETTYRAQRYLDYYVNPDSIREALARGSSLGWLMETEEEQAQLLAAVTDEQVEDRTRRNAFELFKGPYIYAREDAGGHLNPLIWGGDYQDFADIDPNEIVTFQFKPKPDAKGGQFGALGEWRSYGSDNVDVVDELNLFSVDDLWTEKSLIQRVMGFVKRGGEGSGFHGHVGREGEVGGSAPEGISSFQRPGMSAYGSGVFTPMLKDVIYGWQDEDGWGTAQMIYVNVVRAKEQGDEDYEGMAIGEDGILQGIGALDYNASNSDFEEQVAKENPEFNIEDYLKIDGLYTPDPSFSEELIVQMAAEAAKHEKGLWMKVTDLSGPFAMQMGMSLVAEDYAYWTPEQVAEVAQKATGLEPTDYYAPPDKPRLILSFDDAYTETMPENPISGQPAPTPVSEMSVEDRYRWENFNYSNWALPESWNPKEMAKEQLGLGEEEEPSNIYDIRVSEDLQNVHDGWIDGTTSPWSVRFSEAVSYIFGGEPIPESRPRDEHETPQDFLDVLAGDYGVETVINEDISEWKERDEADQWARLDEFHAFASGAREEDIATDLTTVVQSMYDTTQAKFKEAGYSPGDTVRLYRGLQSDPEERLNGHDGGWADIKQWAVSSWTAAKVVAGNFATMEGERSTIEKTGTLLTADIPIENILCNWQTGPGSHGEFEYLVLGKDPISAYATKAYSDRMYRDAKEGVAIEEGESLYDIPGTALGPEIE